MATLEAYAKAHPDVGSSVREVLAALRPLDAASVADLNPGKPLRPQLRTVPKPEGVAHRVFSLAWHFGRRKGKSDLFCADCGRMGITPKYMQAQPCTRIAAGALGSGRRSTLLTELAALPRATPAAHKRLATALRALLALAPPHAPTAARAPTHSRRDARYALRGERLGEARHPGPTGECSPRASASRPDHRRTDRPTRAGAPTRHSPADGRTPTRSRRDARYALRGERLGEARHPGPTRDRSPCTRPSRHDHRRPCARSSQPDRRRPDRPAGAGAPTSHPRGADHTPTRSRRDARYAQRGEGVGEARHPGPSGQRTPYAGRRTGLHAPFRTRPRAPHPRTTRPRTRCAPALAVTDTPARGRMSRMDRPRADAHLAGYPLRRNRAEACNPTRSPTRRPASPPQRVQWGRPATLRRGAGTDCARDRR